MARLRKEVSVLLDRAKNMKANEMVVVQPDLVDAFKTAFSTTKIKFPVTQQYNSGCLVLERQS
jgi:hypothetical protein